MNDTSLPHVLMPVAPPAGESGNDECEYPVGYECAWPFLSGSPAAAAGDAGRTR